MSLGEPDSFENRAAYDLMRFCDPATGEIPRNIKAREIAYAKKLPKNLERSEEWVARGPGNVGGRTRGAAVDLTNPNRLLAGSVTGGLFKSENRGERFDRVSAYSGVQGVTCIVQDPREGKENRWYYGTGEDYGLISVAGGSVTKGDGLFFSLNGGEDWIMMSSTMMGTPTNPNDGDFDTVWKILVDHTKQDQDVLYVAVPNAIMRSPDGGLSWSETIGNNTPSSTAGRYVDVIMTPSGVMYASISSGSADRGFYRSEDGLEWTEIAGDLVPFNISRTVIAVNPCDENEVVFLSNVPGGGVSDHQLLVYKYLSGDGSGEGGEWESRTENIPNEECQVFYDFDFGSFNSQSSYDLCMTFHPTDCNTLLIGGTNIYRSTSAFKEYGYDWIGGYRCNPENPIDYVYPNHHPDQHLMFFDQENPNAMYSANDGGLFRTENILADSVSWTPLDEGYITTQFYTVAIEPGEVDNNIVVGGTQDNGTRLTVSGDIEVDWSFPSTGDGSFAAIAEGRDAYYLSWQRGRILKYDIEDDGTVNNLQRIDQSEPVNGTLFITPFILDATDNDIMYMCEPDGVHIRRNLSDIVLEGENYVPMPEGWEKMDLGPSWLVGTPSYLEMSRSDGFTLYMGSTNRRVLKILNPKTSPERVDITGDEFPSNGYVSCIAVDELDSQHLMVNFSNYNVPSIFHSTDGGENWTNIGGNLEGGLEGEGSGPAVITSAIHHSETGIIYYAGTSAGLFSTELLDGENTIWSLEAPELIGHAPINMLKTRAFDHRLVVGTHAAGIFSNGVKEEVDAGIINEATVEGLKVERVYPNPFADFIKIELNLDRAMELEIDLFDLQGRKVAEVSRGSISAGAHRLKWSASDLPKGAYLLKFSNGSSHLSRKVFHVN